MTTIFNLIFLQTAPEILKIPTTNDIGDFYKWAIGVLIFVAVLSIKFIYMLIKKNDRNYLELKNEAKSERDELKSELSDKNDQLEEKNKLIIDHFEKNSKSMATILEKNNFLLENNTKVLNSLEHAINGLRDTTMNSLLHLRKQEEI